MSVGPRGRSPVNEADGFVPVFETGRVYEWDVAKATLERSGIPCFGQTRTVSGTIEALEHPAPGPGVSFALLVPSDRIARAQDLLREIGLSPCSSPDIWHFNSSPGARRWWRRIAFAALLAFVLVAIRELYQVVSG